jgi:hypothetical protein
MSLSMHAASVPVFKQMLASLADVLAKAEAHASEQKIDPEALLQARLFPDMFADLQARIADTRALVESLQASAFVGSETRDIVLRPGTPKERTLSGQGYLMHYGLPQFFFHVTTTYALLRHNGVEIGKKDFMGAY